MDTITTTPPASKSWTVNDWVGRFEAVGGYLTPGGIGWVIYGRTAAEQMMARAIFAEIEGHEGRRKAVTAFSNQPEQVARYRATLLEGLAA